MPSDKVGVLIQPRSSSPWGHRVTTDGDDASGQSRKVFEMSLAAQRTFNPIRNMVDNMTLTANPEKKSIVLSLGDPTVHGAFTPHPKVLESVKRAVEMGRANGYLPSVGSADAREAIRKLHPNSQPDDIIVTSGCSGAIELAITAVLDPGDNILVPQPGFPLYGVIAKARGVEVRHYILKHDYGWEADLHYLEQLMDQKTKMVVVTNPSNPCGSVYSKEHLLSILKVAKRNNVILLADEIYGDIVFPGRLFYPLSSLSSNVPVITVSGLAKQYLVPGWRLGWLVVHDPSRVLVEIRKGLKRLTQMVLGASSLLQFALRGVIEDTPPDFKQEVIRKIHENAHVVTSVLSQRSSFQVIEPQGAMYVMVKILFQALQDVDNDIEFCEKPMSEESVMLLPGSCFRAPGFVRLVLTPTKDCMKEAPLGQIGEPTPSATG